MAGKEFKKAILELWDFDLLIQVVHLAKSHVPMQKGRTEIHAFKRFLNSARIT